MRLRRATSAASCIVVISVYRVGEHSMPVLIYKAECIADDSSFSIGHGRIPPTEYEAKYYAAHCSSWHRLSPEQPDAGARPDRGDGSTTARPAMGSGGSPALEPPPPQRNCSRHRCTERHHAQPAHGRKSAELDGSGGAPAGAILAVTFSPQSRSRSRTCSRQKPRSVSTWTRLFVTADDYAEFEDEHVEQCPLTLVTSAEPNPFGLFRHG